LPKNDRKLVAQERAAKGVGTASRDDSRERDRKFHPETDEMRPGKQKFHISREDTMISTDEAQQLKAVTDAIVKNLKLIQSFGYNFQELVDIAKVSAQAAGSVRELVVSQWTLDEVEEIGIKATRALSALQTIEKAR
jgi:hypothetical protein